MTNTYTRSSTGTFTLTSAKYLVSKVRADLYGLQVIHDGRPLDNEIDDYVMELVHLLLGGYVESVSYGFEKNGRWVAALNYEIWYGAGADDRSGRVPIANSRGARFTSFLTYSRMWWDLPDPVRRRISDSLPIKRVPGTEPGGVWSAGGRGYSRDGVFLLRRAIG